MAPVKLVLDGITKAKGVDRVAHQSVRRVPDNVQVPWAYHIHQSQTAFDWSVHVQVEKSLASPYWMTICAIVPVTRVSSDTSWSGDHGFFDRLEFLCRHLCIPLSLEQLEREVDGVC